MLSGTPRCGGRDRGRSACRATLCPCEIAGQEIGVRLRSRPSARGVGAGSTPARRDPFTSGAVCVRGHLSERQLATHLIAPPPGLAPPRVVLPEARAVHGTSGEGGEDAVEFGAAFPASSEALEPVKEGDRPARRQEVRDRPPEGSLRPERHLQFLGGPVHAHEAHQQEDGDSQDAEAGQRHHREQRSRYPWCLLPSCGAVRWMPKTSRDRKSGPINPPGETR